METGSDTEFEYSSDQRVATIGDYVRQLLEDKQYLGTVLPRIPTLANRDILAKLHSLDERRQLKKVNEASHMRHKFRAGTSCMVRINSHWDEVAPSFKGQLSAEKWVQASILSAVTRAPFNTGIEAPEEDEENQAQDN